MTNNPNGNGRSTTTAVTIAVIIASAVVALGVIGAAVALALSGRDATTIIGLVGPSAAAAAVIVAALGRLVSLDRKTDEQTEKIDQVVHQTNGSQRAMVRQEIRAALAEHLGPPAQPPTPTRRPKR